MLSFLVAALLLAGVILLVLGLAAPGFACLVIGAILACVLIGLYAASRGGPRVPPPGY